MNEQYKRKSHLSLIRESGEKPFVTKANFEKILEIYTDTVVHSI